MKTKLKQILYDMRHQPVIAWVTFIATAMSVFMIMVVIMMQSIKTVPFAPESCRERLLMGKYLHIKSTGDSGSESSGNLSHISARMLYEGLEGVEQTSYFTGLYPAEVSAPGNTSDVLTVDAHCTDAAFFDIFDHKLIEGRYYTAEEADALMPVAVISESTARDILGDTPWTGREIVVDNNLFTVVGVIADNTTLATTAHGDLFTPTGAADTRGQWGGDMFGPVKVALLVDDGVDFQKVREQVKARYSRLDAQLAASEMATVYHGAPFDQETTTIGWFGSNTTPDPGPYRRQRLVIYAILLIVPAINLSSMLHSRIRRRVNEIGVRRAFGCTRRRILTDILVENFIVTLAGGLIGVALGIVFAATYSGLYETVNNIGRGDTPTLSALLSVSTIAIAIVVCFILNILSASVPAWLAARMNPVDALNSK